MSSETDELVEQYMSWTVDSVDRLLGLLDTYDENDPEPQKWRDEVFGIAHDVKGMGSSFGFPLMTQIGTTLCHYLKNHPKDIPASKSVVEAHAKAMKVVLDNVITGDGGEKGVALTSRLTEIANKALAGDG
ncbi:MAG: Hpt domain-containing protein [Sphingomonadales bacterium]|nr:Hpt domain-containing protein [Sphingomonadales bacterium]